MKKILFVCLGNICRSPAADGYMSYLVKKKGLSDSFFIDSAGTSAHHEGEQADKRMRKHAHKRGYELESLSRPFLGETDFKEFDLILAMDRVNLKDILAQDSTGEYKEKVKLFCEFCNGRNEEEVPDPYWGGDDGFELVLDIVENGVEGILKFYGK